MVRSAPWLMNAIMPIMVMTHAVTKIIIIAAFYIRKLILVMIMGNKIVGSDFDDFMQLVVEIVGTKGASNDDSEYRVYDKRALLKRLEELLPDNPEFGYSVISRVKKDDYGV